MHFDFLQISTLNSRQVCSAAYLTSLLGNLTPSLTQQVQLWSPNHTLQAYFTAALSISADTTPSLKSLSTSFSHAESSCSRYTIACFPHCLQVVLTPRLLSEAYLPYFILWPVPVPTSPWQFLFSFTPFFFFPNSLYDFLTYHIIYLLYLCLFSAPPLLSN